MAYFDIAANSITAQPVTAYLQGRAMRMAYEGEKQAQQFQQMQMADWQKQRDFDRQTKATELEFKQQEFDSKQQMARAESAMSAFGSVRDAPDKVAALGAFRMSQGLPDDGERDPVQIEAAANAQMMKLAGLYGVKVPEKKEAVSYSAPYEITTAGGLVTVQKGNNGKLSVIDKGGTSVNVALNGAPGNEKFSDKAGELAATRLDTYRQQADDAVQTLTTIKKSSTMLDKGMITGFAGDWRLNVARALNLVGADNTETIANTEAFVANQGNEVGRIIKLFGSGTGLSDADREYAAKIAAGDISMNQQSMRKIINIREKQARWTIKNYADERGRVKDKPGIEFYPEVAEPPAFGGQTAEKTATNPQTGEVMAFRDGKWVKK